VHAYTDLHGYTYTYIYYIPLYTALATPDDGTVPNKNATVRPRPKYVYKHGMYVCVVYACMHV